MSSKSSFFRMSMLSLLHSCLTSGLGQVQGRGRQRPAIFTTTDLTSPSLTRHCSSQATASFFTLSNCVLNYGDAISSLVKLNQAPQPATCQFLGVHSGRRRLQRHDTTASQNLVEQLFAWLKPCPLDTRDDSTSLVKLVWHHEGHYSNCSCCPCQSIPQGGSIQR